MTIVEELRKLIKSRGGDPTGIMTIDEAIKALKEIEDAVNPLSALEVDADIGAAVDLLGKVVADLQKDVVVGPRAVTGTLHYIDDYTGFSGDPEEQEGHYLAVHASVPEVEGVTIKLKISTKEGDKTLDPSDGILILRVDEKYIPQDLKLTFTASKTGCVDYAKTLDLTGLVLEAPAD